MLGMNCLSAATGTWTAPYMNQILNQPSAAFVLEVGDPSGAYMGMAALNFLFSTLSNAILAPSSPWRRRLKVGRMRSQALASLWQRL